jgi:hypothetical protein
MGSILLRIGPTQSVAYHLAKVRRKHGIGIAIFP